MNQDFYGYKLLLEKLDHITGEGLKIYIRVVSILLVLCIVGITIYNVLHADREFPEIDYSTFLSRIEKDEITDVHLRGGHLTITDVRNKKFSSFTPDIKGLLKELEGRDISVSAGPDQPTPLASFWGVVLAIVLFMVVVIFFIYRKFIFRRDNKHCFAIGIGNCITNVYFGAVFQDREINF